MIWSIITIWEIVCSQNAETIGKHIYKWNNSLLIFALSNIIVETIISGISNFITKKPIQKQMEIF